MKYLLILIPLVLSSCYPTVEKRQELFTKYQPKAEAVGLPRSFELKEDISIKDGVYVVPKGKYRPIMVSVFGVTRYTNEEGYILINGKRRWGAIVWGKRKSYPKNLYFQVGEFGVAGIATEAFNGQITR